MTSDPTAVNIKDSNTLWRDPALCAERAFAPILVAAIANRTAVLTDKLLFALIAIGVTEACLYMVSARTSRRRFQIGVRVAVGTGLLFLGMVYWWGIRYWGAGGPPSKWPFLWPAQLVRDSGRGVLIAVAVWAITAVAQWAMSRFGAKQPKVLSEDLEFCIDVLLIAAAWAIVFNELLLAMLASRHLASNWGWSYPAFLDDGHLEIAGFGAAGFLTALLARRIAVRTVGQTPEAPEPAEDGA